VGLRHSGSPDFRGLPEMEFSRTLKIMQVHFTPDQEAQLVQTATKSVLTPKDW
jgi:hypothetical protein